MENGLAISKLLSREDRTRKTKQEITVCLIPASLRLLFTENYRILGLKD